MARVMRVTDATVDSALDSFIQHYAEREGQAWHIASHLKMYAAAERSFDGDGGKEAYRTIYDELRGTWQALRPVPKGTWDSDTTYCKLRELDGQMRPKRLSELCTSDWPAVWRCIYAVRDLKPNKYGPSVVAISKFLHFWNPRLFMIVDVQMMNTRVLGHRWLSDQVPPFRGGPLFPGADDEKNANLCWYLRILQWVGALIRTNPYILTAFVRTFPVRSSTAASLPSDLETFEALAVEWFLLGLVELPPAGVTV